MANRSKPQHVLDDTARRHLRIRKFSLTGRTTLLYLNSVKQYSENAKITILREKRFFGSLLSFALGF